jgi:hypothetical protein
MGAVRGFARHMFGIDPANEIPPLGLATFRRRWRQPFIYADADIVALMEEVPCLGPHASPGGHLSGDDRSPRHHRHARRRSHRLDPSRYRLRRGLITVLNSKFNKSRELPLDPTTVEALPLQQAEIAKKRLRLLPGA